MIIVVFLGLFVLLNLNESHIVSVRGLVGISFPFSFLQFEVSLR